MRVALRTIHAESRRTYGSPRIHRALLAQGQRRGGGRSARLMRGQGLRATRRRRYRATPQSAATRPAAPNTLGRQFAVRAVNRLWAGDVTACWTSGGSLDRASLLDRGSRRVVGWATSAALDQALTQRARRRALAQRQPAAGLLPHSGRGTHYTREEYRASLTATALTMRMSRWRDGRDNAVMERFFATRQTELVHDVPWATRAAATAALAPSIEGWYNPRRRHATLDCLSPAE